MKPVSQPMAQKLDDAGWSAETTHHYLQFPSGEWVEWEGIHPGEHLKWLPRPTLDEVLEELPHGSILYRSSTGYWMCYPLEDDYKTTEIFANSADAAADAWIKTRGKG